MTWEQFEDIKTKVQQKEETLESSYFDDEKISPKDSKRVAISVQQLSSVSSLNTTTKPSTSKTPAPIIKADLNLPRSTPISPLVGKKHISSPRKRIPSPTKMPGDAEIYSAIKIILTTADLMSITKKSVRAQLSRQFGVDMNPRKAFINESIDEILRELN